MIWRNLETLHSSRWKYLKNKKKEINKKVHFLLVSSCHYEMLLQWNLKNLLSFCFYKANYTSSFPVDHWRWATSCFQMCTCERIYVCECKYSGETKTKTWKSHEVLPSQMEIHFQDSFWAALGLIWKANQNFKLDGF